MVLADVKASHMTQHHPILQPVTRPHFRADGRGEAEGLRLDGVGDDLSPALPVRFAKVVDARVPPAGPQVGGCAGQQLFAEHLQRPLVVPDDPDIMGVGNAHGQPRLFRALQGVQPHGLVVGVQDADAGVCGYGLLHKAQIRRVVQRVKPRALVDMPAQTADLVVVVAGLFLVDDKIKLDLFAVDMPVVVHQHGLDPAAVHIADRMQHSYHGYSSHYNN